jgi:hypothetical protein
VATKGSFGTCGEQRLSMAAIYLLNVPEFWPIADAARAQGLSVKLVHGEDYLYVSGPGAIEILRKGSGVKLPVWFGAPTGGLEGRIEQFDREILRVIDL